MSNPLAITSVTAAFAQLLKRALQEAGIAGAKVMLEPPHPSSLNDPVLNLFLYEVNTHPGLLGHDAPFRDGRGDLIRASVLALNLRYVVTAYGKGVVASGGNQLEAQHMLAHAMSYVNDNATLTRTLVREAINAYGGGGNAIYARLSGSDLDAQVELVKLTPLRLTPEETSKLWSALNQQYRLSVAYEASVVLVERRRAKKETAPVRSVGVHALPIRRPVIESVSPQTALIDGTIAIAGRSLAATDGVKIRFPAGDVEVATVVPTGSSTTDRKIEVELQKAEDALGVGNVRAGAVPVQVVHQIRMGLPPAPGQPPTLHRGFESNTAVFVLAPKITPPSTSVSRGSTLQLSVDPPVGRTQRTALVLGGAVIENVVRPQPPSPIPETTSTLAFRVPADFPTGSHLLQLRVDGADSPLDIETNPASPDYGKYLGPKVTIT